MKLARLMSGLKPGPTRLGAFPQPVQSGEGGFQTRENALSCPDWATSPRRALALVRTPSKRPLDRGDRYDRLLAFHAFISQAMISPLVTASARKKRAVIPDLGGSTTERAQELH